MQITAWLADPSEAEPELVGFGITVDIRLWEEAPPLPGDGGPSDLLPPRLLRRLGRRPILSVLGRKLLS